MDQHKYVDHQLGNTEGVGVGGSCLHAIQSLIKSWYTHKTVDPHHWSFEAKDKVEEVCGKQGNQVPLEMFRAQVTLLQVSKVLDQDALIQVTWKKKNKGLSNARKHSYSRITVGCQSLTMFNVV